MFKYSKLLLVNHKELIMIRSRRNLGLKKWLARDFQCLETIIVLLLKAYKDPTSRISQLSGVVQVSNLLKLISNLLESVQNSFFLWLIRHKFWFQMSVDISKEETTGKLSISLYCTRAEDELNFDKLLHRKIESPDELSLRIPKSVPRHKRDLKSTWKPIPLLITEAN